MRCVSDEVIHSIYKTPVSNFQHVSMYVRLYTAVVQAQQVVWPTTTKADPGFGTGDQVSLSACVSSRLLLLNQIRAGRDSRLLASVLDNIMHIGLTRRTAQSQSACFKGELPSVTNQTSTLWQETAWVSTGL